jgi:hypothetical protein
VDLAHTTEATARTPGGCTAARIGPVGTVIKGDERLRSVHEADHRGLCRPVHRRGHFYHPQDNGLVLTGSKHIITYSRREPGDSGGAR